MYILALYIGLRRGKVFALTKPADGEYNKYTSLIYHKSAEVAAANGYSLSSYAWKNLDGTMVEETDLIPGKQYRYSVLFGRTAESRFAPPFVTATLDGVTLGQVESATEPWIEINTNTEDNTNFLAFHLIFTVPGGTASDVAVNAIGIDAEKYSVSGQTVTVTHDKACKVGYLDGDNYKAVEAVKISDGKYSFTVPDGVKEVILVVKGDANGDGKITTADKTILTRNMLASTHPAHRALNEQEKFTLDLNNDGTISVSDKTLFVRSTLLTTHPAYKALDW